MNTTDRSTYLWYSLNNNGHTDLPTYRHITESYILTHTIRLYNIKNDLSPQTPQTTDCCYVGAAALVHFRLGRPSPPAGGFNRYQTKSDVSDKMRRIRQNTVQALYDIKQHQTSRNEIDQKYRIGTE